MGLKSNSNKSKDKNKIASNDGFESNQNMIPPPSNSFKTSEDVELDSNLKIALKSTSMLFIGAIIDTILGLICTILVARFYSVGEYGIYSLAVFFVIFIVGISGLGIYEANSRYISFYRGKNELIKIKGVIKTSFLLVIVSSTLFAITLFFLSDFIAVSIFGIEQLSYVLKIFVISIPFWATIKVIISTFRGFESAKEKVYFTFISIQLLKAIFFICVIFFGLNLNYIFIGFLFAILITFTIAIIYFYRKFFKKLMILDKSEWFLKEILSFSWPLLFSSLAWFLISGTDKIMLGILASEVEVGYYTAATPIAKHLIFFYMITVFIFQPIASKLFAQKKLYELKNIYQVLTKWLFTLAFPFIMVLLLFPGTIITLIYGSKYIIASTALQLITIGIMIYLILALSREIIIIMGKTRIILYFTLVGGGINIIMNYLLIPYFGINGAAFSTMISFILINGLIGLYLYRTTKIHPFRKNLIVPMLSSLIILLICYFLIMIFQLNTLPLIFKIGICCALILSYFIIILKTKSYDKEDIQLYLLIEKKIGYRFKFIRKIIRKLI